MANGNGLVEFLKTKRSKQELEIALSVLREFKSNESDEEWAAGFFLTWAQIEKFENMLVALCESKRKDV